MDINTKCLTLFSYLFLDYMVFHKRILVQKYRAEQNHVTTKTFFVLADHAL